MDEGLSLSLRKGHVHVEWFPVGAALSGPNTVAVSGPLAPSEPGQALATLMVTLGQAAAIRVSAAFSLLSTFRPQRIFTAAHSPT